MAENVAELEAKFAMYETKTCSIQADMTKPSDRVTQVESENVAHNVQLRQLVDEAMRRKSCGQSSSYANKVKGDSHRPLASDLMNSAKFPALQGGIGPVQMWKHTAVQQDSSATANGAPMAHQMANSAPGSDLQNDQDGFRCLAEQIRRELWQGKHLHKVQAAGQWHGEPQAHSDGNRPVRQQG